VSELITGATDAADPEAISESLAFAGFVCVNWLMKEKFLDLQSPVGKKEGKCLFQIRLRIC
jgi:hypothetical protein